ncbi:MAG: enoyl-CoA hydratase [Burkholderiaceae bacterium]
MSESTVVVTRENDLALVTLNRPKARNALNTALRRALRDAIAGLAAEDAIKAVILTGADPAFCAGLDLKELGSGDAQLVASASGAGTEQNRPMRPWAPLGKPLIGAINGVAVTGGFELALNCDFLIASEHARFADTHSRVGVMPGWGLTVLLPEAVGIRRAREMSATGNFIDARTALTWGLVNHVVPHERLLTFARELARDIAGNEADGVRRIYETYEAVRHAPAAERDTTETRMAREWAARGLDAAGIEKRRTAIQARGRDQSSRCPPYTDDRHRP